MGQFLYGTELPTLSGSGVGSGSTDRYDLAHAKEQIEEDDTHTIVEGEQYIVMGSLDVVGTLAVDGTLVIL